MRICAAQTKPITGDIQANIERHLSIIDNAVTNGGADVVIFSELSLTGYEPTLAKKLATNADDARLARFQDTSDKAGITIGTGLPTINGNGFSISMVLFQPGKPRQVYSKKYLHPDEDEFFIPGKNIPALIVSGTAIGIAICYELSIPEHSATAHNAGAEIYIASVAKFAKGVENSLPILSGIANKYSMPSIMVNAVGPADNGMCTGNSSVWNNKGELVDQLDNINEGILILDTTTGEITKTQF
jgi:predicted amidohydrolase